MLKFVHGCPGSGKSTYLAGEIAERLRAGGRVILIVPERFSVSAEQAVTSACRNAGILNLMDLEILSFKRLCNRVFREYGGLCYNYAGKGGQLLVMWQALCEAQKNNLLGVYKNLQLRDSGTVEAMLENIVAFKRAGITPDDLESAGENCTGDQLKKKLADLAVIFRQYDTLLRERYGDPEEDLNRLADTLEAHSDFFGARDIFVDSTSAFTAQERRILALAIRQAKSLTVALGYLPGDKRPLFDRLRNCERQLREEAKNAGVPVEVSKELRSPYGRPDDLTEFEKWLFDDEGSHTGSWTNIRADRFSSPYVECQAAAARILRSISEQGGHFYDHAVAVRDLDAYKGIVDRVFEANGIPCTLAGRTALSDRSACRAVKNVLRVFTGGFRREDLFAYIRTGYSGLDGDEAAVLEDYATLWRIDGKNRWLYSGDFAMNPLGHTSEQNESVGLRLLEINRIRDKLTRPLGFLADEFTGCKTVEDYASTVWHFLSEQLKMPALLRQAVKEAQTQKDERAAQLNAQTWRALCEVLDELVYTVGSRKCEKLEEWAMMFDVVSSRKTLGSIPEGKDRVLISDVYNLKPGGVLELHVLGMNDGILPAVPGSSGIFTGAEVQDLAGSGLELPLFGENAVFDEEFICHNALTLPRRRLYVSCAGKNLRGGTMKPSELFTGIRARCAQGGEEDLLYGASNCQERAFCGTDDEKAAALRECIRQTYGELFDNAAKSPLVSASEQLTGQLLGEVYGSGQISVSPSRLEEFVNCPFNYTCKHLLGLSETPDEDPAANEIGVVVHSVFESLIGSCIDSGKRPALLDDEEIRAKVDEVIGEVQKGMLGGGINADEDVSIRQLLRRIRDSALVLAMNLRDEFSHSRFEPKFTELVFNSKKKSETDPEGGGQIVLDSVVAGENREVLLNGVADRVDVYKAENGDVYLRVVDYKTGTKLFRRDALKEGMNLQMMLYMKTLCECVDPGFLRRIGAEKSEDVKAAEVVYHVMKKPMAQTTDKPDVEAADRMIAENIVRSGMLVDSEEIRTAIEDDQSGRYGIYSKNKNYSKSPSPAVSADEFNACLDELDKTLTRIAAEMRSGSATAIPRIKSGCFSGCTYCQMRQICRRRPKDLPDDGEGKN